MKLHFTKMQGCGNDYIYLDCRTAGVPENIAALCLRLCPRRLAVGADGIICICPPVTPGAHAAMRMFNADGSEGAMCGNGVRCVAQWLAEHDPLLADVSPLEIDTASGRKTLYRARPGVWRVNMGRYSASPADLPCVGLGDGPLFHVPLSVGGKVWPASCISMGNPHCVTLVPALDSLDLAAIGPAFEHHPAFPRQVNTEFVQLVDATHLKLRVWERGSGETWACGTGTCAAAAAMTALGHCPLDTDLSVQLLGGSLTIRVMPDRTVWMTGPAVTIFEGETDLC